MTVPNAFSRLDGRAVSLFAFFLLSPVLGWCELSATEKAAEASRAYEEAMAYGRAGDWQRAKTELEKAAAIDPERTEVYPALLEAHYRLGEWMPGLQTARRAIEKAPHLAGTHFYYGLLLLDYGVADEAIAEFKKVLEINPQFPQVQEQLARAYQKEGMQDLEFESLQEAIRQSPGKASLHRELGEAHEKRGRKDLALAAYQKALELDPRDAASHFRLGSLYERTQKPAEALWHYEGAAAAELHAIETLRALASLATREQKWASAIHAYEKLVQAEPGHGRHFSQLGFLYQKTGEHEKAVAAYERAIALEPDEALNYFNLGILHQSREAWDKAAEEFEKALERDPRDGEAQRGTSIAHCRLGHPGKAWGLWDVGSGEDAQRQEWQAFLQATCPLEG